MTGITTSTTGAVPASAGGGRRAGRAGRCAGRRTARDFRHTPKGWLYSAPAVLIFGASVIVPTFYTFYVSLWNWNVLNPSLSVYKGLGNYAELFRAADPASSRRW